jgi:hypothetical protein
VSVLVHITGALEPVELDEPFQATLTNLSASQRNDLRFFVGPNMDGEPTAIQISNITHMIEKSNG